ncbi:hypothetical protein U1Q18_034364 [Sarracenia purpurea var. burkii]
MRATQPELSEFARGELGDIGGRNSNPQLALISPQTAELRRVTTNKEVDNQCGGRNIRPGMEISPEIQGLGADSSSNQEVSNSIFKNQGAKSGLQLGDEPKGAKFRLSHSYKMDSKSSEAPDLFWKEGRPRTGIAVGPL